MKPIDYIGEKAEYDEQGQMIWAVQKNGELNKFLDLRGWGYIQYMFKKTDGSYDLDKAIAYQDEIGKWVVDAINEKLKREKNL